LNVFKRGRVYWFDIVFQGKRFQKSTKETNKVKAEGIAATFRSALAAKRVGIVERPPVPTFAEAMKAFLEWSKEEHREHRQTYRRYVVSSKPLLAYPKFKKPIDEVTAANIEDYKIYRAGQTVKRTKRLLRPATINRELACMKAMYNHTLKERHDFRNPVTGVEFLAENNEQTRVLTFEEQRKYLGAAAPLLKDVATLILETGMRPEEVFRSTVGNVDLDHGYLLIPFGKTKAARRRIPLTSTALAILKRRAEKAQNVYLFPHRTRENQPMTAVTTAHRTALKNSKVRKFRLYDCRHTFATRAAESGMDLPTLAALLGHSKIQMVMRYAHPTANHQADSVKRLEAFNAAKEIAEVEKKKQQAEKQASTRTVPTVSTTLAEEQLTATEERVAVSFTN